MAARHRVANLSRRGNVFYWRARIPAGIAECGLPSHLSLSLRHSDHKKAGYMARRLNTLLAELTMRPDARMTTKEQLEALFRSEIDRMADHLDDIVFAARRTGSDPKENLRADLEVGWAYRLIELFGTARRLSFEEGCPGRNVLERAGVPSSAFPAIITTFRQEQEECRSPRFGQTLAADMDKHGIPDTMVNREKATMQLMRAKAEVLLDIGGRYGPETEGLTAQTAFVDEAVPTRDVGGPSGPLDTTLFARSAEPPAPTEIISTSQALANSEWGLPSDAITDVRGPDPRAHQILPRHQAEDDNALDLPLDKFMEECEALIKSQQHSWEPKTAQDVRVAVRMLVGILEEHGVRRSGELSQFHIGQLRSHFDGIPRRYGQSARLRVLSTKALREAAARQVETAQGRGEEPPPIGLLPATIRKHLGNITEFLKFLRGRGYRVAPVTMDGLRPRKTKAGELRSLTDKPGPDTLRQMFHLPIFTGCKGPGSKEQALDGTKVFHCANYFLPMLIAYLGPRRSEIASLAVRDVVETRNGWAIHIRANDYRRVKNVQSVRMLPVPDELLRLNFLQYLEEVRALGYGMLFPEIFHTKGGGDPGDRFYKDFVPLLKQGLAGEELWNRALHALRHGQADTLKQAEVDESKIDDISGRLGRGETSLRYTNPAGLPLVRSILARYPIITDHLEPRPIQLLPWVAECRPAPWQGRTRQDRLREARSRRSPSRQ